MHQLNKYNFPFTDTQKEKATSNKNHVLTKSMNMGVWVVGELHQFYIRDSYAIFSKKWSG